jgi:transketolase
MRDRYFDALYEHFKRDKDCIIVVADNGAPSLEKFAAELPGQYYNVGIAEQQMVGMASGLAMTGKKVWCYAIAPFVTTRVHEFVKLDVAAANLPIHMVGVGAGFAYDIMSLSHHCVEDIAIIRALPNMTVWSPADGTTAAAIADFQYALPGPSYVRLDRGGVEDLYGKDRLGIEGPCGMITTLRGEGITIVATGVMVHQARQVAIKLGRTKVIDAFCLKPFNSDWLTTCLAAYPGPYNVALTPEGNVSKRGVVTLEEHQINGGLGTIVAEAFADHGIKLPLLRIAVPDSFTFEMGDAKRSGGSGGWT